MKYIKASTLMVAAMTLGACSSGIGTHTAGNRNHVVLHQNYEDSNYKLGSAGAINAQVGKNADESSYRYAFSIDLKTAEKVQSVRIERLNDKDVATLVIDDSQNGTKSGTWQAQSPQGTQSYLYGKGLGKVSWVGQSAPLDMTKANAPWLYQSGSTHERYRITITDKQGHKTSFIQGTQITDSAKRTYLNLMK